jgi:murein DD-endopeptidase MepM/ murein hydrolase activator NlpD
MTVLTLLLAAAVSQAAAESVVKHLQQDEVGIEAMLKRATSHASNGALKLVYPVAKPAVDHDFGPRMHPVLKREIAHHGVDFEAATGTPVLAAGSGEVLYSGWYGGYGKVVILEHARGLTSLYAHLNSFSVAKGAKVKAGQAIAQAGDTGMSSEPHLHFELRRDGKAIDPKPFFKQ